MRRVIDWLVWFLRDLPSNLGSHCQLGKWRSEGGGGERLVASKVVGEFTT